MGEASEGRSRRAMEALSLLQRFSEQSRFVVGEAEEGSEEIEVNLNLGLSLGGRFGVDKSSSKLVRSSSIAGSIPVLSDAAAGAAPLTRTASLPVETEEQWRKRKELQSLRRMEAKRRRSEKQRGPTAAPERDGGEIDGEARFDLKEKQHFATANRFGSAGLPSWAARTAIAGGSVESVGGSSSGNSELESKTSQGRSSCGEARSSAGSIQSNQEQPEKGNKNECRAPTPAGREGGMENMPCVFTKGDGPDGRRVDGILYKYGKGEEVRIMCVCHGSFLSPADFVKHAGGREVSHPLRHIVINPSASTSLS